MAPRVSRRKRQTEAQLRLNVSGRVEQRDWNKQVNPLNAYAGEDPDPKRRQQSIEGNFAGIQGAGNEQLVAARLLKHGFVVFFKLWGDTKYDMVIECEGYLFRAQVKGTKKGDVKFTTRWRGGEDPKHRKPTKFYTRDDCDLIIGVDSENGDCYVVPVDYSVAKRRVIINFKDLQNFKERWDFISGNDYLSVEELQRGVAAGGLQNKLRQILPRGAPVPSDLTELTTSFYEKCPPPRAGMAAVPESERSEE